MNALNFLGVTIKLCIEKLVGIILSGFSDDLYTHSCNVCSISIKIAQHAGLSQQKLKTLGYGALLHDIGKSCINKRTLNKPDRLTDSEFRLIKTHTILGKKMLEHIEGVGEYLPLILYHHERWDGTGYEGLSGDGIPELASIITIADSFDAMTAPRPYQKRKTMFEALTELNLNKGTQFAPQFVEAFEDYIIKHLKGSNLPQSEIKKCQVFNVPL